MRILIITVFSIGVVAVLYVTSKKDTHADHEFIRIIEHDLHPVDTLTVPKTVLSIASFSGDTVFVSDNTDPYLLHVVNLSSHKVSSIRIQVDSVNVRKMSHPQLLLNSSSFILADGGSPLVLQGKIKESRAKEFMPNSGYFVDAVPISQSAMFILSVSRGKYVLGKQTIDSPYVKLNPALLQKQVDGIFCSDGILLYNHDLKRVIYIYFYRNQFLQVDTALSLVSRNNTIDPIDTARIEIVSIGQGLTTHAKPPLPVNVRACTSDRWLFINSSIRAKNEQPKDFNRVSVIDVYDLLTGLYQHSFYVPVYQGTKRMKSFIITGDTLIALYEGELLKFKLRTNIVY